MRIFFLTCAIALLVGCASRYSDTGNYGQWMLNNRPCTPAELQVIQDAWTDALATMPVVVLTCSGNELPIMQQALLTYPSELRERVIIFATSPLGWIDFHLCRQVMYYKTTPKRDLYGIGLGEDGISNALVDGIVHDITKPGLDYFDSHIGDPSCSAPMYEHHEYAQTHGLI